MDAVCKLSSYSCFLEGTPRQRFEPNGAAFPIPRVILMQRYPQFQFLFSDPGGCFVSNELRDWAGVRGIGLLTAPGEFHGLTADLENLIRVIKTFGQEVGRRPFSVDTGILCFPGVFFSQQWFQYWRILASPMGFWGRQ